MHVADCRLQVARPRTLPLRRGRRGVRGFRFPLPLPRSSGAGPEAGEGGRGDRTAGQALVEFAIGAILFMLLTLGVMQFAILYHMRLVMAHACREGARYGAARLTTSPYTSVETSESQVRQFIIERAGTLRPPLTEADISFLPANPAERVSDSNIQVIIRYDFRGMVPLIAPMLPSTITFTASARARLE